MKKYAFTLAEILITLGVIGVVSSITLPALISYHKSLVLKTQFNKAYNELQQINQSFIKDYDMNICEHNWQMWNETGNPSASIGATSEVFIKYYNGSLPDANKPLHTYSEVKNLTGDGFIAAALFDDAQAVDLQQRTFYFEYGMDKVKCPIITVDINGYHKKPNQMGVDIFSFRPTKNGKILPLGEPNSLTDEIDGSGFLGGQSCTCTRKVQNSMVNGLCCAYWASIDVNPDNNSKTYWTSFVK